MHKAKCFHSKPSTNLDAIRNVRISLSRHAGVSLIIKPKTKENENSIVHQMNNNKKKKFHPPNEDNIREIIQIYYSIKSLIPQVPMNMCTPIAMRKMATRAKKMSA